MHTLPGVLLTAEASSILDSSVVDFVVDAAGSVIGIMTTPPLGIFLTIGLVGAVVGVVGTIVALVKGH